MGTKLCVSHLTTMNSSFCGQSAAEVAAADALLDRSSAQ